VTEVWFVGVKTAGSLIHRAISLWRELLPAPYEVRGVDVEPGSPGARNVELLEELRTAPGRVAGAVVSVHKVGLRRSQEWPLVGNPPRAAIPRPQYPSANVASSDIIFRAHHYLWGSSGTFQCPKASSVWVRSALFGTNFGTRFSLRLPRADPPCHPL